MTWHRYTWLLWAQTLDGQQGKAWFATSVLGAALPSALGSRDTGGLVPFPLKPTVALALGSLRISRACDRGQRCLLMGTPSRGVHLWQYSGRWHWACLVAKEKVLLWVGSLPPREPRVWAVSQCCPLLPVSTAEARVQLEGSAGGLVSAALLPPAHSPLSQPGVPTGRGRRPLAAAETPPPLPPQAWPQRTVVLGPSLCPGPGPQVQVAQQDPPGAQPLRHGLCGLQGRARARRRGQVRPPLSRGSARLPGVVA